MMHLDPFYIPKPEAAKDSLKHAYSVVEAMGKTLEPEISEFCETVWEGEIPEYIPEGLVYSYASSSISSFSLMRALQERGYFARITKQFIAELATMNLGTVLDPFAGSGFFVKALREAGIPAIATDDYSWGFEGPAEKLDALQALRKYSREIQTVVFSWVPYESTIDMELYEVIKKDYPWLNLLVISEGPGGCIGSEAFGELSSSWPSVESYRSTYGLHDYCVFKAGDFRP